MRPIEHATQRGYRAHLRRWEEACTSCRDANNAAERDRYRTAPQPPRQVKPCPSEAAYMRHRRNDERPCPGCRAAHAAYERGRSRVKQAAA